MIAKILGTVCTLLLVLQLQAETPRYHKVKAQAGEGIYSLMGRYRLNFHQCNFDQFYLLNKLNKKSKLQRGKEYYIPVLIYKYNGKSIRSTIGDDDWDRAVRIRDYNYKILADGLRQKTYEDSKVLWVPYHELNCEEPDLPKVTDAEAAPKIAEKPKEKVEDKTPSMVEKAPEEEEEEPIIKETKQPSKPAGNRTFAIFGKDHAYTPLQSSKLAGKVFYIVGGHGGPDPGAVGTRAGRELCEDEYAYDVALRLCRNLVAHGAVAYMILRDPNDGIRSEKYLRCDKDEVLWGNVKMSSGHKTRLFQRSGIVNDLYKKNKWRGVKDQLAIMFHVDSRTKGQPIDVFFYHHGEDAKGKKVALQLQKVMRRKYKKYRKSGEYYGTVSARDLHMLREVKAPAVYIELGNISHERDQQRIVIERNRQLVADWLFEGLVK